MKKFLATLAVGGVAFAPLLAGAQTEQTIGGLGLLVLNILNIILLIILALAFLYFVWNVVKYIMEKEAKGKEEARKGMIAGIIGLFVIFSAWGLVRILQNTIFGTGGTGGSSGFGGGTSAICYSGQRISYDSLGTPSCNCTTTIIGNICQ